MDWTLAEVLAGAAGAPGLDRAEVVQPALWAVMVSLAAVWQAAGVTPDAVAGHRQGEIAAACVAGILTLEDAAKVVALRSRALTALAGRGAMVSVAEPADAVRERLAAWGGRLSVAAVNGPAATVVSGDPARGGGAGGGVRGGRGPGQVLPVDYASHSAQVEQLREEILSALAGITPGPARIPMVSAMTGEFSTGPKRARGTGTPACAPPVEFDRRSGPWPPRAPGVHRGVPAPGADRRDHRDAGQPRRPARPVVTGTLRRDDGGPARFLAALAGVHVARRAGGLGRGAGRRASGWTCPPTRSSGSGTGRQASRALVPAGGDGAGSAAEARFWAAVEAGDVPALAETLAVQDRQRLGQVLPALAAWRRRERDRSADRGLAVPGDLGAGPRPRRRGAAGNLAAGGPAGLAGGDLAQACAQAMAGARRPGGRRPRSPEADRERLADWLAAVAETGSPGSWGGVAAGAGRGPVPGPGGAAGWPGRWRWCRRWATPGSPRRCGC